MRGRVAWIISRGREEGRVALSVMKCPELAMSGKLSLLLAKARYHTGRLKRDAVVDCRVARIRFGRESFPFDWYVFDEIFIKRIYRGLRFECASVLDLGAHKGYFAVFALSHCATRVVSFEPEAANFRRLAAAAEGVAGWTVRQEGIAGEAGVRRLRIKEAWSHKLVLDGDDGDGVTVPAVALGDVLGTYAHERQLVKVDIEGAECEALARTPRDLLARIDELVVEAHADAPCRPAAIVAIAEAAGLSSVELDLTHPAPILHFAAAGDAR
jgi:FkbM family methyltransferase